MSYGLLLLTLLPVAVILCLLIVFRRSADVSGLAGWIVISLVAFFGFHTSGEVILRSTAAGLIKSFAVSLIVATSLLQMAYMEKTGALKRIIIFLKTIASDHRAVQIMMINIGFGTLMVAVGATPVSILPPILLAMGYSTFAAIALPAVGYDSLCTYALLGAPIVVLVDVINHFPGNRAPVSLHQVGMIFFMLLPLVSTLIGFCMLWIVGRWQGIREGWLPCLITGAVIGVVAYFTNHYDNLVVLTGVLCGIAVIITMALYLKIAGRRVIDKSRLSAEELSYEKEYPLWKALMPWLILIVLILALNLPKSMFNYLYRTLTLPIKGLTADGKPLETRALWQAYTWIFASIILSIPFMRPTMAQMKESLAVFLKRAPRPVFAAAIFFAIGEVMGMSGFQMAHTHAAPVAQASILPTGVAAAAAAKIAAMPSMVEILAHYSASLFHGAYGFVVAFIGLFGGFITGSEASTIGMFGKYAMLTAKQLNLHMIIITAGLAFGGGLASVISPAKLQNAAAAIDKIGEEGKVIRMAFIFSILLTAVTAGFVVLLLALHRV